MKRSGERGRPSDADRLRAFLSHPGRPAAALSYHEFQGFLFAVVSAPDAVMPSEWLPMVHGHSPVFKTTAEAESILQGTMAMYNGVNEAVLAGRVGLPRDCPFRDEPLSNLEDDAPVHGWSRGFLKGHTWLEESWDLELPDELSEELGAALMVLTFFADRRLAEGFRSESSRQPPLAEMAASMQGAFKDAMAGYAHLGWSIYEALREFDEEPGAAGDGGKVGRNEPCPCGSGEKHKRCCGAGS